MLSTNKTESSVMTDMLIVLLVLAAVSVYYYGLRAAAVIILSVFSCWLSDVICLHMRNKKAAEKDISALVTGLTLGLMMSASVPYFAVVIASVFAIVLARHAFGGHGCEIFSAAAAGFLFTSLCFPENMLFYPRPFSGTPLSSMVS
ncbi:MAG: RnfABCDGE type electron transport complex subunit D, partial [Oscillospiraceae bacterium]|nr:RnfABCDGE type electron transport complex subunit D [Oscillospiraceae bacterium]